MNLSRVELTAGPIEFRDTGGAGPTVVLLHGLMMNSGLWDEVITDLGSTYRCIAPVLPMGAHRLPVAPDADLSLPGLAELVLELLVALDLRDVTLIGNDTGGAIVQLVAAQPPDRLGRIGLVSCEAFDNLPPGLTGRMLALTGKLSPSLFGAFMQQLRLKPVRRLPIAFGWLTKRGDAVVAEWITALLASAAVRRDTVRMLRTVFADRDVLVAAAAALSECDRPALVIWAAADRVMPLEHGRRLAELLPRSELIMIEDSYTLIPLDQPAALSQALRAFLGRPVSSGRQG